MDHYLLRIIAPSLNVTIPFSSSISLFSFIDSFSPQKSHITLWYYPPFSNPPILLDNVTKKNIKDRINDIKITRKTIYQVIENDGSTKTVSNLKDTSILLKITQITYFPDRNPEIKILKDKRPIISSLDQGTGSDTEINVL